MTESEESGEAQIRDPPAAEASQKPHAVCDVFVSYESHDIAVANAVVTALEHQGIKCWIAPRDVTAGALYADEIIHAINGATVLVAVLSERAIESPHVRKEIERASSKGRPIITLKADSAPLSTTLEYFLSESQWVDLAADGDEVAFKKLLAAVHSHLTAALVVEPEHRAGARLPSTESPTPTLSARLHRRLSHPTIAIALTVTIIGVGIAVLLHAAFSSRNVVVEPFEVPPTLSERGETGTVVASAVLDELTKLHNATPISAALAASAGIDSSKLGLSNAWSSDITLAAPQPGISLRQIYRLIENRFGHDIHISGSLIETETGGLMLTVRGDGVPPKSFKGAADELTTLSADAAEYIYAQSQPALWVKYLSNRGRYPEVIAFAKDAVVNGEQASRPYFLTFWADALAESGGSKTDAMRLLHEALSLKADYWTPYLAISSLLVAEGDEEGAWRVGEQLRDVAGGRPGRAPEAAFSQWDALTWNLPERLKAMDAEADLFGGRSAIQSDLAGMQALRHDPDAAELALNTITAQDDDPYVIAGSHWVRGLLGLEAGDAVTAITEMEAFGATLMDPSVNNDYAGQRCWLAPAEEAVGRFDKANAALIAGGTHVDCYRFRADILDQRGDWAAAQKAYADAVALAPDLPAGYYSWGVALAKHGDLAGAEAKLKAANQRGPHWADPLKAWGDVLFKQGKSADALAKYDEALRYAPKWKQLLEARRAVAKQRT